MGTMEIPVKGFGVCVTVRHWYYDISNQRVATAFEFINLFNSALHVSGNKFAHPQEPFLTVCTAFGTMHRSAAVSVHCTKGVYRVKKCS